MIERCLPIIYGCAPLVAFLSSKSMVVALIMATLFNIQRVLSGIKHKVISREWHLLVLLVFLVGCSYFWSIDPLSTKIGIMQFLSMVGLGFLFIRCAYLTQAEKKAFIIGYGITLVVLTLEYAFDHPWRDFRHRSDAFYIPIGLFMSIALWPCLNWLMEENKKLMAAALFASSALLLRLIECDTILLSIFLAPALAFPISRASNKGLIRSLAACIIILFTTLTFILKISTSELPIEKLNEYIKDSSYIHRVIIWKNASERIMEHPVAGHGFRTYRSVSNGFEKEIYSLHLKQSNGNPTNFTLEPLGLHPHNIALHLYFELGILGALLGGLLTASLFLRCCECTTPRERFFRLSFFTTAMIIFWINIGAFQNWWLSSIIFLMALFKRSDPRTPLC